MSLSDQLALAAIIISSAALIITVIGLSIGVYQTRLASDSLQATQLSLDKMRRQEHLELLPSMHFILHARGKMEGWLKKLVEVETIMGRAMNWQDPHLLPAVGKLQPAIAGCAGG